jgi:hypothetical protein
MSEMDTLWREMNITAADVEMNRAGYVSPHQEEILQQKLTEQRRAERRGIVFMLVIISFGIIISLVTNQQSWCAVSAWVFINMLRVLWQASSMLNPVEHSKLQSVQVFISGHHKKKDWIMVNRKKLFFPSKNVYKLLKKKHRYQIYFVEQWIIGLEEVAQVNELIQH